MLDPVAVERVEAELDSFIEKRARERKDANTGADLWRTSDRAYREKLRAENRDLWLDYHQGQATRLRHTLEALIAKHEERVRELQANEVRETA